MISDSLQPGTTGPKEHWEPALTAREAAKLGITKIRGQWKLYRGTTLVMPTYHPSYLLRPVVEKADLKLILRPELAGIVFVGTILLCLASSMISFRKVASIDPGLVFRG